MHYSFITRGCKSQVDRFIGDLQAQYFPTKIKKNGKVEDHVIQLGVRPIQLWEVVMPEEHLQEVINMIQGGAYHKWMKKFLFGLRKMMGFKKAPLPNPKAKRRFIYQDMIEIAPIGIKKDVFDKDGNEVL